MSQCKKGISPEFFALLRERLTQYKNDKAALDGRIIENDKWYKSLHWENMPGRDKEMPMPVTAHLFNALSHKHADAMDNYPMASIMERTPEGVSEARILNEILPVILERAGHKSVYSRCWWYKLKNGAAAWGVFYNDKKGGIDIKKLDLLNVYWEWGVSDIELSPFLFITSLIDKAELLKQYPHAKGAAFMPLQAMHYSGRSTEDKAEIVDCYYKKDTRLHLVKFCADTILDSTEGREDTAERGLYDHGRYPIVIDALYPEEDSPVGFGLIDIAKNPQIYIDRLDEIISRNALVSGKLRWLVKDNGGVNEAELLDMSSDIIHVAGPLEEANIRPFQCKPLDAYIANHRNRKIDELKEICGNRDFQQGGVMGGVTAASAITVLQQSGEKLSRDMIGESYEAQKQIYYLCIELIRQFYETPQVFRLGDGFISYSNRGLAETAAEFDIKVLIQKQNPFMREAHNNTMLQLWGAGVFDRQNLGSALLLLQNMQFEGRERLVESLKAAAGENL